MTVQPLAWIILWSKLIIMILTCDDKKDSHSSCMWHRGTPLLKMAHTYSKEPKNQLWIMRNFKLSETIVQQCLCKFWSGGMVKWGGGGGGVGGWEEDCCVKYYRIVYVMHLVWPLWRLWFSTTLQSRSNRVYSYKVWHPGISRIQKMKSNNII